MTDFIDRNQKTPDDNLNRRKQEKMVLMLPKDHTARSHAFYEMFPMSAVASFTGASLVCLHSIKPSSVSALNGSRPRLLTLLFGLSSFFDVLPNVE